MSLTREPDSHPLKPERFFRTGTVARFLPPVGAYTQQSEQYRQRGRDCMVVRCWNDSHATRSPLGMVPRSSWPLITFGVDEMNEIMLEEVGLEEGQILADSIRKWRSDCQAGQFKIGATTMCGHKLDMELVGAQISEGEYFGYPHQKWLALLFVDPDGVLSSILFKTESLDNFEEMRRAYRIKGETLLGKTIRASMSKRSSMANGKSYFAVEFEVASEGKYSEEIAKFRQRHYSPDFIRLIESRPDNGGK